MARKKEKINFKYNLKTYFSFLSKYKLLLLATLLFVLYVEASHTFVKFLFKIIIDNGTSYIDGSLDKASFTKIIFLVATSFLVMLSLKGVFKWLNIHTLNILDTNLIRDLKRKYFNHILHLSHNFHTTHKTGSLISRLNRGAGSMERMTDLLVFNFSPLIFQLAIALTALAYFSWVTAVVLVIIVITFLIYSLVLQQIQQKYNLIANQAEDIEKGTIADVFTNIDSIKYFGKEDLVKNKFAKLSNKTKDAFLKNWGYYRWIDAGQSVILGLGTFFVVYFPLMQFLNNEISLGTLVFIYTVYGDVMGPMFSFVSGMRNFYRSMADFNDLFIYGKFENDIKDMPNAPSLKISKGEIEYDDVSFSYNKRRVITSLSLKIKPGDKVALVGHSGSGKTTLIKLLYRFYDVNSGSIKIDGLNIKDVKQESLRSELSIVPQECILFDDTIYSNILFSNPKASRAEVIKAMKFAQLDKFVESLPLKENTIVGERGVKLSGGEKQRVSIARALLANKKILVLDEATSSLDSETEHEIQSDLNRLMEGRTSIIIAHRLSTIMSADKIIVMEKGKIVQIGSHLQLIKQPGTYRRLWNLQKGGYLQD